MEIADTYSRSIKFVEDGTIHDRHGRVLNLRDIIKRRWGWPKKAANLAAEVIFQRACMSGDEPARIWVAQPERWQQQQVVFAAVPDLLGALMSGLCNGSSREAHDCDHDIVGISLSFTRGITDDGMVRNVIDAVARRMDCTADEVRSSSAINSSAPVVSIRVDVAAFDEGMPHVTDRPDSGAA